MTTRIEVLEHGVVYRNQYPNRVSEYVTFPVVQALPDDSLLCMCRHGTARESDDGVIRLHRSTDGGHTWTDLGQPFESPSIPRGCRLTGGFGVTRDGEVMAMVVCPRAEQRADGQPLCQFYGARSCDGGLTFSKPVPIEMPPLRVLGPGGNLVTCSDGTLLAAAETQGDEHGTDTCPWTSMILRSSDGGRTWSGPHRVQASDKLHYFDIRIMALPDGRLLAAYWAHDLERNHDVNVHTAWSEDAGVTWSAPRDAGFVGQVTVLCSLGGDRVVAISNHRREPFGVRALFSENGGASFDEATSRELWGTTPATIRSAPVEVASRDTDQDVLSAYHHYTFGSPSVTRLADGTVVAVFYVTEENVTFVRSCRFKVRDDGR